MYLSKLEMLGFKSFANKTKLKFDDGIACVIGPNGSGKSNIVDAIRWVLGEQRVTSLRSDKMESIIFSGTSKRKPLGLAEVSLTIQNNKKILESPFSEVVISRRLYRDGESQYLMNRTPCRLKDISNLFMDTGMNANSYSVIELKMVENIISENADDRRLLFEEAAGVTKYKIRRKSAFRKLSATKDDMSRISDMINEITRTVNSLSRQVGKTRRYLKFQEELKNKEIDLARFNFNRLKDEIEPLDKQLKEISIIKDDTSHQITLEETLLEEYKQDIIQFEQKLSSINKKIFDFDKEIQIIQEEEAVSRTRIESLEESKRKNTIDIEESIKRQSNLKKETVLLKDENISTKSKIDEIESEYYSRLNKYESLFKENNIKKQEIEQLKNNSDKIKEDLFSLHETNQNNKYKLKWNEDQILNFNREINELEKTANKSINTINNLSEQQKNYKKQLIQKENENKTQNENLKSHEEHIKKLDTEINELKAKETILESKIQFFKNIIESYEGHTASTKYVMQNKSQFKGLYGPLSDFISTNMKYNKAVEAALDSLINYIIVDNTKTALSIINEFKNKNLGKISLLPLDQISKYEPPNFDLEFPILSNLIETDDKFRTIYNILFGDIAVVDNIENAFKHLKYNPNLRFVTLNGETVNFNMGITSGNYKSDDELIIGREKQLQSLNKEIKEVKNSIKKLLVKTNDKENEKNAINDKIKSINFEIAKINEQLITINQNISQSNFVKENTKDIKSAKESEINIIQENINSIKNEIEVQSHQIIHKENESSKLLSELNLKSKSLDKEIDSLNALDKELQSIKLKLVHQKNEYQIKENNLLRTTDTIHELDDLINKRKSENVNISNEVNLINENRNKRQIQKEEIYEKRDILDNDKENFEANYHELRDKILNLENQIKKFRKQHDSTLERTKQLELNIQENKMKSEIIKEKIREEYGADITTGIPFDGLNIEEYEQNIETLKFKIKQLGQVNPLAVNEYETESKRLEFYKKQYNDLEQATDSLQKTIDKINLTARKQFKETFKLIKQNFEKVFSSFFINGEGTLSLEEGVDPLESNIEILVRPKGKRLQTLNLLSGGEKTLTAISLLFSIYLVKPSPFCILDEIDAPLDDVNIKRFTDALKNFAKETQFIVITHNKRTMEAADTLYGVTMEEEGLSKLVSVKFT